jgi:hypothetical protein
LSARAGEEIEETERAGDRSEEKAVRLAVAELAGVKRALATEAAAREQVRELSAAACPRLGFVLTTLVFVLLCEPLPPHHTPLPQNPTASTGPFRHPGLFLALTLTLTLALALIMQPRGAQEDNLLLDTMLYAQQRLQEAIIRSFSGGEAHHE